MKSPRMPDWRVWPSPARLRLALLIAFTASLVIFATLQIHDRALSPDTIVSLELAFTPERADTLLKAWGPGGVALARESLWIDFAFMPAYAFAFAGLVLSAARAATGGRQQLGFRLLAAPFAAWAYDLTENLALLRVLANPVAPAAAPLLLAGIVASLKFALLLACLGYWLAVLVSRRQA